MFFCISWYCLFRLIYSCFADQKVTYESSTSNTIISSEAKIAECAFFDIKDQIIHDYSQLYKLDDFSYDYTLRDEIGKKYLDINVYVDMTLTRHPSESPYVLGMEKAIQEITDTATKEKLQADIDAYINEIETLYFNIPNRSTFTYAVELDDVVSTNTLNTNTKYKLFYRTDTDEKVVLTDADCLSDVENFNESYQAGYQAIDSLKSDTNIETLDVDSPISARIFHL